MNSCAPSATDSSLEGEHEEEKKIVKENEKERNSPDRKEEKSWPAEPAVR